MKESRHIAVNEAKWDKWADTLDGKGWRNEYLRDAQSQVISMLEIKENTRLLDIGCGTGWALGLANKNSEGKGEFYGVDLSEKMIEKAKDNFKEENNFHFIASNATSVPLQNDFFDFIICTNSFHHYLHPDRALSEMRRLLKPAGKVYILDPTTDSLMMKIIDKIVKLSDKAHVKMYSTKEFEKMCTNAGLKYTGNKTIRGPEKVHTGEKQRLNPSL